MSAPSYISGRILDPTGQPIAGASLLIVPDSTIPQPTTLASTKQITVLTDSGGNLSSSMSGLAIWPGSYRMRINGIDVFRFTVPADGALHSLTSLLF